MFLQLCFYMQKITLYICIYLNTQEEQAQWKKSGS